MAGGTGRAALDEKMRTSAAKRRARKHEYGRKGESYHKQASGNTVSRTSKESHARDYRAQHIVNVLSHVVGVMLRSAHPLNTKYLDPSFG
jgi:hypothetical protein